MTIFCANLSLLLNLLIIHIFLIAAVFSEVIGDEYGFLSNQANQLIAAMADRSRFDKARLHQYARDCFNSDLMVGRYLDYCKRVLNEETCNKQQPQLQPAYT